MKDLVILNKSIKSGNYEYNGESTDIVSEDLYDYIKAICSFKDGLYQINIINYIQYSGNYWYKFKGLYRKNGVQCVTFNIENLEEYKEILESIDNPWYLNDIDVINSKNDVWKGLIVDVHRVL